MTTGRLLLFGLLFLVIAWAGAAVIAVTVVEVSGGGPRGEQGLPGLAGPRGPQGPPGPSSSGLAQVQLKRLASMWAVQTFAIQRGEYTEFADPRVEACVDYIINGTGDFTECPGFYRSGPPN